LGPRDHGIKKEKEGKSECLPEKEREREKEREIGSDTIPR
jgi:hypothetical protein